MAALVLLENKSSRKRKRKSEDYEEDTAEKQVCSSLTQSRDPEIIITPFKSCLRRHYMKVSNFLLLKSNNQEWKSPRLRTYNGYPFMLYVRPNGLRCTKQYGQCMGVWFKPLPYDLETSHAKVNLSITIERRWRLRRVEDWTERLYMEWSRHHSWKSSLLFQPISFKA